MSVCVRLCSFHSMWVEVRACELLAFGSWGLNLSYQSWWQALLPLEPSLWSCAWLFYVGPRDLNRGPLACTSVLLTKVSTKPWVVLVPMYQEGRCCWGLLLHSSSVQFSLRKFRQLIWCLWYLDKLLEPKPLLCVCSYTELCLLFIL